MRLFGSDVPDWVRSEISDEVIKLLETDNHGISYPTGRSMVQTRARRDKECIDSRCFSFRQYGGIEGAILTAIAHTEQIRLNHPVIRSKTHNVRVANKFDYRNGKTEYRINVDFNHPDGRPRTKTFSFGHKKPSNEKLLHGIRTGHLFRQMFEAFGQDMDFDIFRSWKTVRLYDNNKPFDW